MWLINCKAGQAKTYVTTAIRRPTSFSKRKPLEVINYHDCFNDGKVSYVKDHGLSLYGPDSKTASQTGH